MDERGIHTLEGKWDGCWEGPPEAPSPPPQGTRLPLAISGREETTPPARCHPSRLLEPRAVVKSPHVDFEDRNQNVGKSAQGQGQARSAPVWCRPRGTPIRTADERIRRTQGVKGGGRPAGPVGTSLFVKMEQSFPESLIWWGGSWDLKAIPVF